VIDIKGLSFSFGKNQVFKDFNLQIPDGQVCLITGINGVGKSTLLRLMAGVLRPDRGEIRYDAKLGADPRRKVGFVSDALSLYESLTVAEAIGLHESVYGLSSFDDSLVQHTKIGYGQKVRELSIGQRTIFHLSLILSFEPDVLLVDEIIHSIDAYLRRIFLEQIVQLLSTRRMTVVMVNVNFHDIERLVERVILLKSGEITVDENIDDLKAKVKKIVGQSQPTSLNVLSRIDYSDHSEFFVYPFNDRLRETIEGDVFDLNLTEIVSAFIGGEYA
jgi:ABC-2 type transport system ATP-binding protein